MEIQHLDYVLVPLGLLLMLAYHLWLLRQIIRRPAATIIGVNAINRRLWVHTMMQDTAKFGVLAVQTFRNNIMASTVLASTAIMLSSIIAVLMSNGSIARSVITKEAENSKLGFSIKFFSIIVCFLTAFLLNVQSIRFYSHASILINVPNSSIPLSSSLSSKGEHSYKMRGRVTAEYVAMIVNRGSYFWSVGLRAFYLSFPLFLWIFGPVPMVLCCLVLVLLLYYLDVSFQCGLYSGAEEEPKGHKMDEDEANMSV